MGPDELCLEMARFLLNAHPNLGVDEYTLAYAIQDQIANDWTAMMTRQESCDQFAANLRAKFNWQDDDFLVGLTIQDFADNVLIGEKSDE